MSAMETENCTATSARRSVAPLAPVANKLAASWPARRTRAAIGLDPERDLPPFTSKPFKTSEANDPDPTVLLYADTFARNPDNSDEGMHTGVLAWRNAWPATEVNDMTNAAVLEKDSDKRAEMYMEIQRLHQMHSPFAPMFQKIQQVAMRNNVENFSQGGSIHSVFYWPTTK